MPPTQRKFLIGRIVTTPAVAVWLMGSAPRHEFVLKCLDRHGSGDWGNLAVEDATANDHAMIQGERILSAYQIPSHLTDTDAPEITLWIVTEADRSATTVSWPGDY